MHRLLVKSKIMNLAQLVFFLNENLKLIAWQICINIFITWPIIKKSHSLLFYELNPSLVG